MYTILLKINTYDFIHFSILVENYRKTPITKYEKANYKKESLHLNKIKNKISVSSEMLYVRLSQT